MKKRLERSLSTKIVLSVLLTFMLSLLAVFIFFRQTNKTALYNVEREKAQLIADTMAPLLAIDYYLSLENKANEIVSQLKANPNILALRLERGGNVLDTAGRDATECLGNGKCFDVRTPLLHPVTGRPFGTLELVYSSAHFIELSHRHTVITFAVVGVMALLSLLFSFYLRSLLTPLHNIATVLRNYSPESGETLTLPAYEDENEIGRITSAFREMDRRVVAYARIKENMAHYLEEEVEKKTAQLQHQLYTDGLTGYPNRTRMMQDIHAANTGVLLIVNIDEFRQINDFYGHAAGDRVLIEVADILHRFAEAGDGMRLYKLTGDEFALFSTETMEPDALETLMKTIGEHLESVWIGVGEAALGIRVTLGASLNIRRGIEEADIAFKTARLHRKPYLIYDGSLDIAHQYRDNLERTRMLKLAVEEDRIVPYYQPVFDNATRNIIGYECLMRLIDKDGSVLTPERFLPVAKKARLHTRLTRIMVEKGCRFFAARPETFSINLSVEDMLDEPTVAFMRRTIAEYGVGDRILFEILESEGIENYDEVGRFITTMKRSGCRFAIDDFGSGYSNFEHLLHLDIDFIKIDGSLIRHIDRDVNSRLIVEAIVNIAQRRGLACVAEYVHDAAVFETVTQLGIARSQGYYLGEPRPTLS